MATCADCVHVEVCTNFAKMILDAFDVSEDDAQCLLKKCTGDATVCNEFADRARFVELPDVGDYDTVTTIDEAIDHCYQIATSTDETACAECKAEHMRLCGWLGDLKRRIAAE